LRQHILATPLGKKKSPSASMAGEDQDKFKVDPKNGDDVEYDDLPEEQRLAFEIQLKQREE